MVNLTHLNNPVVCIPVIVLKMHVIDLYRYLMSHPGI